jgi:hypothetical protein
VRAAAILSRRDEVVVQRTALPYFAFAVPTTSRLFDVGRRSYGLLGKAR